MAKRTGFQQTKDPIIQIGNQKYRLTKVRDDHGLWACDICEFVKKQNKKLCTLENMTEPLFCSRSLQKSKPNLRNVYGNHSLAWIKTKSKAEPKHIY